MIKTDTYNWNFGIIIPSKSGVLWEQQTEGVMCNHIEIEGIYIPLDKPFEIDNHKIINLLEKLKDANYRYKHKEVESIWNEINEILPFIYEKIENSKGQPKNQEGLQWLKIIKLKHYKDKYRNEKNSNLFKPLLNKKIALIYPNCD